MSNSYNTFNVHAERLQNRELFSPQKGQDNIILGVKVSRGAFPERSEVVISIGAQTLSLLGSKVVKLSATCVFVE